MRGLCDSIMNYIQYYQKCLFKQTSLDISKFTYQKLDFKFDVTELAKVIGNDLSKNKREENKWAILQNNPAQYLDLLMPILEPLVSYLENEIYSSYIFVDKVHIYRSIPLEKRVASSLYHYDNFPPTILKSMIYLTDTLTDDFGPIEFCKGFLAEPTRSGADRWFPPVNNSRIDDSVANKYEREKVYGAAGETVLFYPNNVHRARLPTGNNYRDVINVSTRPTHDKNDRFKYIRGFEAYGSPLVNPEDR